LCGTTNIVAVRRQMVNTLRTYSPGISLLFSRSHFHLDNTIATKDNYWMVRNEIFYRLYIIALFS